MVLIENSEGNTDVFPVRDSLKNEDMVRSPMEVKILNFKLCYFSKIKRLEGICLFGIHNMNCAEGSCW